MPTFATYDLKQLADARISRKPLALVYDEICEAVDPYVSACPDT